MSMIAICIYFVKNIYVLMYCILIFVYVLYTVFVCIYVHVIFKNCTGGL